MSLNEFMDLSIKPWMKINCDTLAVAKSLYVTDYSNAQFFQTPPSGSLSTGSVFSNAITNTGNIQTNSINGQPVSGTVGAWSAYGTGVVLVPNQELTILYSQLKYTTGHFSLLDGSFTAPTSGYYQVSLCFNPTITTLPSPASQIFSLFASIESSNNDGIITNFQQSLGINLQHNECITLSCVIKLSQGQISYVRIKNQCIGINMTLFNIVYSGCLLQRF